MLKKILVGLASLIVGFLAYVALQSPHYEVKREITIQASAEKIFPYLNSSKMAEAWAPWLEMEPETKMNYSGPDSGVGSKASWQGGKQLGTGSATIVESVPNQLVGIELEYVEPHQMKQYSQYIVEPAEGGSTRVTWKVTGENNFLGRLMCTFMDMDKMVGSLFEKGLSNLKNLTEKQ